MTRLVLDSWAIIAYLCDEPAAGAVEALLDAAVDDDILHLLSAVNWGEAVYTLARRRGLSLACAIELLEMLPVDVVPASRESAEEAAALKLRLRLGYADAYAAALALSREIPLVTGDPDFLPLAELGMAIEWVG